MHLFGHVHARRNRECDAGARIVFVKLGKRTVEKGRHHMACKGDVHMPRYLVTDPAHQERQLRDSAKGLNALLVEEFSHLRQLKTCSIAFDKPPADTVLEPFQRIADTGLLEFELFGGARDALQLRDHHEGAQEVPVEFPNQPFGALINHSQNL